MNTLQKFIENKNSPRKNPIFIINKRKEISYSEFEKNTNNLAAYLKKIGIKEGNNVAIICDNNSEFISLIFSLWKLKAVPVPINIKFLQKEIEEIISSAECKFVLIHKNIRLKIKHRKVFYFPFIVEPAKNIRNKDFDKNNTALIMFTSGSSGKSKGVVLSFENLIRSALIGNQVLYQTENDRWLASLPFYHIGGFSIIVRTFLSGAALIIPDSIKTKDITSAFKNYRPTLASFVSTQLKRLIENKVTPNKELKNVLIGGGFTSKELSIAAIKKGWKITKVYGSTEVSSFASAITSDKILEKPGSSGKALYPNKIFIIDEKNKKVPANTLGEIIVKSPALMTGYYFSAGESRKNTKETSNKIINKFYYTGDIGYIDTEGYLFVEARRNDLIVSGGENIIPNEIEATILKHPFIKDVFVFGLESKEWGQEVCAAIIFKKNKKIELNDLKEYLRKKLANYKIPGKVFFVDKLPKTSLGKIQKEKLLELINSKIN
jgi:o-succinylbenzoate---CoA ligase